MLPVLALGCFVSALGQPAPADFLIYEPLLPSYLITGALTAAGKTYTLVNAPTWSSMTVADFKQYRAIVFLDPNCRLDASISLAVPLANRAIWSQAIDGNVVVIGTDEYFHWSEGGSVLADSSLRYAGAVDGKTGLYVSLSCYYWYSSGPTPIPILDIFTTTAAFIASPTRTTCFDNAHIVATSPALTGLSDGMLSNWDCSVHNVFSSFPPEFIPLAIANTGNESDMAFADGTYGVPYIMARGEALSPLLCGDGILQSTEECDDGNTLAGDGCNEKCKTEVCGDGIINNVDETCDDGNTVAGDGCSASCKTEVCGDGIVNQANETCDDGNTVDGDGCSSVCTVENRAPDCSTAYIYTEEMWPADCRFVHFGIRGVTDANGDDVFITVTSITQNQPTKSGKDDKCPDANLSSLTLRVERDDDRSSSGDRDSRGSRRGKQDAPKNGRTYKITFTADDGNGGTCTGVITSCVPQQNKCACKVSEDDLWFDSTKC